MVLSQSSPPAFSLFEMLNIEAFVKDNVPGVGVEASAYHFCKIQGFRILQSKPSAWMNVEGQLYLKHESAALEVNMKYSLAFSLQEQQNPATGRAIKALSSSRAPSTSRLCYLTIPGRIFRCSFAGLNHEARYALKISPKLISRQSSSTFS